MAHPVQIVWCEKIKEDFPEYFRNKRVLDVGALDYNGNNRYLFEDCEYIGSVSYTHLTLPTTPYV